MEVWISAFGRTTDSNGFFFALLFCDFFFHVKQDLPGKRLRKNAIAWRNILVLFEPHMPELQYQFLLLLRRDPINLAVYFDIHTGLPPLPAAMRASRCI